MGDMYRYYVLDKKKKNTDEEKSKTEETANTTVVTPVPIPVNLRQSKSVDDSENMQGSKVWLKKKTNLPTPAAFFDRQKRYKASEKQAMLKFAARRTAKHNLHIRYDDLKNAREEVRDELNFKLGGNTASSVTKTIKPSLIPETEQEYIERQQAKKLLEQENGNGKLQPGINGFYLNELEEALDDENDDEINKSILESFFEQYAPERVKEVPKLLKSHKGEEFALFQSLAKEFKINVKANSKFPATSKNTIALETEKEQEIKKQKEETKELVTSSNGRVSYKDLRKTYINPEIHNLKLTESPKPTAKEAKRINSFHSVKSESSRRTNTTDNTTFSALTSEPVTEEMKEFQKALDAEIKGKLYSGEYVVSIVEKGGRWWVNRSKPKIHESQRRRNTLLEDLRAGKIPISNENM